MFLIRYLTILTMVVVFGSCNKKEAIINKETILKKSIQFHDPKNEWETSHFKVHIQEPRIRNPYRYSIVELNNASGFFELQRNRNKHVSIHRINKKSSITFLDGKIITDSVLVKKYRLEPTRNKGYHRFYKTLLGLPMSLPSEIKQIDSVEETLFNSTKSYKLSIELHKELFSKHWILYVAKENFKILGLEMIFPNNPEKGERLIFEGKYMINSINIPRIRHWRELNSNYSGSDILIK